MYSLEMSLQTSVLLAIQLIVLVSCQLPMVSITTADTTTTTVPPPACAPNITTTIDVEAILNQLNNGSGELPIQDPNNVPLPIPPLNCEQNGPFEITHNVPNERHVPEIKKGSCDNLFCQDPPCYARKKIRRRECVHVFKRINGFWTYLGVQFRYYDYHLKCGCKQCEDIKQQQQCNLRPCPNCQPILVFFPNMHCFWDPQDGCMCTDA